MKLPKADKPKPKSQVHSHVVEAEVVAAEQVGVKQTFEAQGQLPQSQPVQTSITSPRYYNSGRNDTRATPFQSLEYIEDTNQAKLAPVKDSGSNSNGNGNGNNQVPNNPLDSTAYNNDGSNSPQGSANGNGSSNRAKHRILVLYLDDTLSLDNPVVAQGLIERLKAFHSQGGNEVVVSSTNSSSKGNLIEIEAVELGAIAQSDAALVSVRDGIGGAEGQGYYEANPGQTNAHQEMETGVVAFPSSPSSSDKPGCAGDDELNNELASDMSASNTTFSQIPEIAELERRLAAVDQDDVEQKRVVIKEWINNLQPPSNSIESGDKDKKRRSEQEIEADEQAVQEWVKQLNQLFDSLEDETTHSGKASREYKVHPTIVSTWKDNGFIKILRSDKNKILLSEKAVAVAMAINKRFGGSGKKMVRVAMKFYYSLQ